MSLLLPRDAFKLFWEPPPCKLLHRRDIDNPVMQVFNNGGHLAFEKDFVGVDRVSGQDPVSGCGDVGLDELEDLVASF